MAVVVLVASPRVAVGRCRRRRGGVGVAFVCGGAMGGQQGQPKPRPHASMAMVRRLSYSSASVCAESYGCAPRLVRFAPPEIASVLDAASSISIYSVVCAPTQNLDSLKLRVAKSPLAATLAHGRRAQPAVRSV